MAISGSSMLLFKLYYLFIVSFGEITAIVNLQGPILDTCD